MLTREQYAILKLDCPDRYENLKCDDPWNKTGYCRYCSCPAVQKAECNKHERRAEN